MYTCLSPGAIGVRVAGLAEGLAAAKVGGFEGLEFDIRHVADRVEQSGADAVRREFDDAGIRPGGWGLPVDWRGDEGKWRADVEALPRLAAAAQAIGCTRTFTWVVSGSNDRDPAENRRFHVERFKPVAEILAAHGCSLGLEYLGPQTILQKFRHPFVHTQAGMLELASEIGPNVGLLLDCWHWYTSAGTEADLLSLTPAQVVYVHVNDAPRGVPLEEHVDNVRGLPGSTGVIPIETFLRSLKSIGYDGPVTPEPFASELKNLADDAERLRAVGASMDRIFAAALPKP